MSFEQWLFVHSEWVSHRVESLPSEDSSQSPTSSLEVQTSLPIGDSPLDLDDSEKESLLVKPPAVPAPAAMTQSDWRPSVPTSTPPAPIVLETERLQAHCIAILEERVHLMDDNLQSTQRMVQEALAECNRQDSPPCRFCMTLGYRQASSGYCPIPTG
jgi:hypothetical protein